MSPLRTAKLTAADGKSTDCLGKTVSIDGTTMVSGAVIDGNTGGGAQDVPGSVYVFELSQGGWTGANHDARLIYSKPQSTAYFAFVACATGVEIVVGAPYRKPQHRDAARRRRCLFVRVTGNRLEQHPARN